jgi:AcrR family transcriptional regulator
MTDSTDPAGRAADRQESDRQESGGQESAARRRAPAGAAVLRADVTEAIRAAVFAELAAVGYGRMSMEGIARRAGVGKAAVYRRWRSKLPLVLDTVSEVAADGLPVPDTGTLDGDVRALLDVSARALGHPVAAQIIPDLLAEAARSPELAEALRTALRDAQGGIAAAVVRQAVARGELPTGTDPRLALDLIAGPLYWRLAVIRTPYAPGELDALTTAVVAALRAGRLPGPPPSGAGG